MTDDITRDLQQALLRDEIVPHFQPMVNLRTGRLIGFEALARWAHPRRGMLDPRQFIPVAEETGMIEALTECLVVGAGQVARTWPDDYTLSINLSPLLLIQRAFPMRFRAAVERSGFPQTRLVCEITGITPLVNFDLACITATNLRASGIRLALDNFGSGHANLHSLQVLPLDQLKLDAHLVRSVAVDARSEKIVTATISLGRSLGMMIVAEGIEQRGQAVLLKALGCDIGQGWLFGRPTPADKARTALQARRQPRSGDRTGVPSAQQA
jgi:EAL domain-containing protein (putative c-di-GMP-specific phosphodiesterase class I)